MQKTNKIIAIVPAAGVGSRMNCDIPKQYLTIGSMTVLEHTVYKLLTHPKIDSIIVAISPNDNIFAQLSIANHDRVKTVIGGETRADSVFSALKQVNNDDFALVHDAARPCVSHDDITQLINRVTLNHGGGILATKVSDTIKRACQDDPSLIARSEDRTFLWAAATPQLFNAKELRSCLQRALDDNIAITDEASAIEYCGGHPLLVECRRDNIKITRPEDILLATFYLTNTGN